jgi:hypothetical protein
MGSWLWRGAANCFALDVPGCGTKRGRDTSAIEFDDITRELNADIEAVGQRDVAVGAQPSPKGCDAQDEACCAPAILRTANIRNPADSLFRLCTQKSKLEGGLATSTDCDAHGGAL